MGKESKGGRTVVSKPVPRSDRATERLIFRIFNTELRDILKRLSRAMLDFVELVEATFSRHPEHPCRYSLFDNPPVRESYQRILTLTGDARNVLRDTVCYFGLVPLHSAPLTCKPVARPARTPGTPLEHRALHLAERLGWLVSNESLLYGTLSLGSMPLLEDRIKVVKHQTGVGILPWPFGNGGEAVIPGLAESDESIGRWYPYLVKPELSHVQLAASDATIQNLRDKAARLLKWRPALVANRTLDPNWPNFVNSYMTVVHQRPRQPDARSNPPPERPGGEANQYRSAAWIRAATEGGLNADLLDKKATRGRLKKRIKRGERWQYHVPEVAEADPTYTARLLDALSEDFDFRKPRKSERGKGTKADKDGQGRTNPDI